MHNLTTLIEQHKQEQQKLLEDITLTKQEIQNNKQRLNKLRQIKIPSDASITDLLAISDLLDTI